MPEQWRAGAESAKMSPAILSNGHLFLTGVTGSGPDGVMPETPEAQFEACFAKIATVLGEAGLDLGAVVEMTSYHIGLRTYFEVFDRVRQRRFAPPWPAWTAVEVAGLRREGALVEIRVVAQAKPG